MADVDATTALANANASAIELAAPTDESLNAGALLPDEPIPDVLTNTVEADAATVVEMLPKLNEVPAPQVTPAQESIYHGLSYLRQDLHKQHGMNQQIATEAMVLLPNFGQGRPVNFYSRHPSVTGYKMALEEIEAGMVGDVTSQLGYQATVLLSVAENTVDQSLIETTDFKRRADQVSMQAGLLRDVMAKAQEAGFDWDDATYRGCSVDPSQNAVVPAILSIDRKVPSSFASMDEYYEAHLDAPAMMELMTTHLVQWKNAFTNYEASLCNEDKSTFEVPTPPTVYFSFGRKTTTLVNIADVFQSAQDKCKEADVGKDTLTWVREIGNAAEQAKVNDILLRATAFRKTLSETAAAMNCLGVKLVECGAGVEAVEPLQKALETFDKLVKGMLDSYRQMLLWCLNAALSTSFAGVLAAKVISFAWQAINQCKDTMQMPENVYLELQTMVTDIQAPVIVNAV